MADRIKKDDLFEGGLFDDAIKGAERLAKTIKDLQTGIDSLMTSTKEKVQVINPETYKDLQNINKEVKNTVVLIEQKQELDKEAIRVQSELEKLRREQLKTLAQEEALRKKNASQAEKENAQAQKFSGILGQLVKQRKELQGQLFTAKTKDEIEKINNQLFKTNLQIKDIKEGGKNSFNTWGNALTSFQFKFNALGQAIGQTVASGLMGLIPTIATFGGELLKGAGQWAISVGLFGDSLRAAKENSAALEGELVKVQTRLEAISKGFDVQFSEAFGQGTETIDLKLDLLRQTLEDFKPKLAGLSEEEKQKVKDQQKEIEDQIAQLEISRVISVEQAFRDSEKRKTEAVKKENIDRIKDRIRSLGIEIAKTKEQVRDQEITGSQARNRIADFKRQIDELEALSLQKQFEREGKVKKKAEEDAEKSAKKKQELLLEDGERVRQALEKERQYRIEALKGDDAEERRISAEAIQIRVDRNLHTIEELEALNEYKKKLYKEDIEAQRAAFAEMQQILDKHIEYELKAIEGKYGEEEQRIAQQSLEDKIRLGTASPAEQEVWFAQLRKKKEDDAKKQLDIEQEKADELKRIQDVTLNALEKGLQKQSDKRQEFLDQEINQREDNIDRQRDLAAKGLANTLAFEEAQKAKAELAKEQEKRREAKRQKAIAFLRLVAGYADKDAKTAVQKAVADIAIASLFENSFAEGVEGLQGKGTETSDSILARLSKNESVITAKATKENAGLPTAMNEGRVDEYFMNKYLPKVAMDGGLNTSTASNMHSSMMLSQLMGVNKRLEGLEKAIVNKRETHTNIDNVGNVITIDIEKGFKKVVTKMRKRPQI